MKLLPLALIIAPIVISSFSSVNAQVANSECSTFLKSQIAKNYGRGTTQLAPATEISKIPVIQTACFLDNINNTRSFYVTVKTNNIASVASDTGGVLFYLNTNPKSVTKKTLVTKSKLRR
jgi:hypothetical protein